MKFTQTHAVGGDETAPFDLSEYPVKVTDFVAEVLKRTHEWGDIEVRGHGCVEYRHGELLDEIPDKWKDLTIREAKAVGGWSYMTYYLFVNPQPSDGKVQTR